MAFNEMGNLLEEVGLRLGILAAKYERDLQGFVNRSGEQGVARLEVAVDDVHGEPQACPRRMLR